MTVHRGGCHCGAVRFEVDAPAELEVTRCNCSACRMTGYEHVFVGADDFRLLSGQDALTLYQFNTGVARHYFCRTCGIKSFYVPRSHPDGYSINFRCLERDTVAGVRYRDFDGADWEGNIDALRQPEA